MSERLMTIMSAQRSHLTGVQVSFVRDEERGIIITIMSAQHSHWTGGQVSFVRDEKEACFVSAFVVFSDFLCIQSERQRQRESDELKILVT